MADERMTAEQVEKMKNLVRCIFEKTVEPMALELTAHAVVIQALKTVYSDLDATLAAARENSEVRATVRKKYHEPLEALLQQVSEAFLQEEVLQKWLQTWKPDDWAN